MFLDEQEILNCTPSKEELESLFDRLEGEDIETVRLARQEGLITNEPCKTHKEFRYLVAQARKALKTNVSR